MLSNNEIEIVKINKSYNSLNRKIVKASIDEISKLLKTDKGYHLNYNVDDYCILFGDIDHVEEKHADKIFAKIIEYFEIGDLSKTISIKSENEYSYHWTFNAYYTTVKELKRHMQLFIKLNPELCKTGNVNHCDVSIYKNNSLMRMPNQSNLDKPLVHTILDNETMDKFVFTYIPKGCELLENVKQEKVTDDRDESIDCNYHFCNNLTKTDYIIALCDILQLDRIDEFSTWVEIGMIIYNELDNYSLFQSVSQLSSKYNEIVCKNQYNSFKNSSSNHKLLLGSLCQFAKNDNLDAYNEINKRFYTENVDNLQFTDEEIVDNDSYNGLDEITPIKKEKNYFDCNDYYTTGCLSDYFKLKVNTFIYVNDVCYNYNNVYWEKENIKYTNLHKYIDHKFRMDLFKQSQEYDENFMKKNNATEQQREMHRTKINKIKKLIDQLREVSYRETLIKDIFHKIMNNKLILNPNPYIFAFENRIYDLKLHQFILPLPEQYITITSKYNYDDNYDKDKTLYNQVVALIKTILPNDEIRDYYMTLLSTSLDAIVLEKFTIANGCGRNGKGVLHDLMKYTLGDYYLLLSSKVFTEAQKSSGNANVDIVEMHNKRFIVSREPEEGKCLNCAVIKDITGGSQVKGRALYSSDNNVNICASIFFECNKKPILSSGGDSMALRIIDVDFPNKFVDENEYSRCTPDEKKYTFLMNGYYKEEEFKLKLRQALFTLLAEYYKKYIIANKQLVMPNEIYLRNISYLQKSDELLGWFNEHYEKCEIVHEKKSKEGIIKIRDVYNNFKTSDYFNNLTKDKKRQNNCVNFIEILKTNNFIKKYIVCDSHKCTNLINHKLRVNEDSDDDEDEEDALN
jgi:phage/plasmid-associated DNA primase